MLPHGFRSPCQSRKPMRLWGIPPFLHSHVKQTIQNPSVMNGHFGPNSRRQKQDVRKHLNIPLFTMLRLIESYGPRYCMSNSEPPLNGIRQRIDRFKGSAYVKIQEFGKRNIRPSTGNFKSFEDSQVMSSNSVNLIQTQLR